jgi:O-methyltransferase involved in polyketide biosynthesis
VPLDFVRDALPEALQRAGHSPGEPTTWIWEGVVMYLDDGALRRGLQGIARASAPGSRLFLHYQEPGPSTRRIGLRRLLLRLMGEPQNGLRSRETMLRELVDAGFEVLEDLGADTQAARLHGPRPRNFRAQASRVLVAGPSPAGEACGQA